MPVAMCGHHHLARPEAACPLDENQESHRLARQTDPIADLQLPIRGHGAGGEAYQLLHVQRRMPRCEHLAAVKTGKVQTGPAIRWPSVGDQAGCTRMSEV